MNQTSEHQRRGGALSRGSLISSADTSSSLLAQARSLPPAPVQRHMEPSGHRGSRTPPPALGASGGGPVLSALQGCSPGLYDVTRHLPRWLAGGTCTVLCSLPMQSDVAAAPKWQKHLVSAGGGRGPAGKTVGEGWQDKGDKGRCTKMGGITWNGEALEPRGAGRMAGARPAPGSSSEARRPGVGATVPGRAPHLETSMCTNSS